MAKSLLVVLDDTPASLKAQVAALTIARRRSARITGVAILDAPGLTAPESVPLGAIHYKEHADRERLRQGRERLGHAVVRFQALCKDHQVAGETKSFEDDPYGRLIRESATHDLIVLGRDTSFHGVPENGPAACVERLLADNPRPVLMVPPEDRKGDAIIVAFDGSVAALRALQVFALLGFTADGPLHLVSIAATDAAAQAIAEPARAYLALYGAKAQVHGLASHADPAEILAAHVKSLEAGLLMMGSFGHRGWRQILLGSSTRALLDACPTSLFVHH